MDQGNTTPRDRQRSGRHAGAFAAATAAVLMMSTVIPAAALSASSAPQASVTVMGVSTSEAAAAVKQARHRVATVRAHLADAKKKAAAIRTKLHEVLAEGKSGRKVTVRLTEAKATVAKLRARLDRAKAARDAALELVAKKATTKATKKADRRTAQKSARNAATVGVKDLIGAAVADPRPSGEAAQPIPTLAAATLKPGYDAAFLGMINTARGQAGLKPLALHQGLTEVADYWTGEMVAGHTGFALQHNPDLTAMVMDARPISTAWGENVAYFDADFHTAKAVFTSYMNSPGHRANILGSAYRLVGLSTACLPASAPSHAGSCYNTMDFAR